MEVVNPAGRENDSNEEQDSVLSKRCRCNGDPVFTATRNGAAICGCTDAGGEGVIAVNVLRG